MTDRFDVDEDLCIGCGLCHERVPENLEVPVGDLVARVKKQPVDADEAAGCHEAAEYCPTGALNQVRVEDRLPRDAAVAGPALAAAGGGG